MGVLFRTRSLIHPRRRHPEVDQIALSAVADAQVLDLVGSVRHPWLCRVRTLYDLVSRRYRHHREPGDRARGSGVRRDRHRPDERAVLIMAAIREQLVEHRFFGALPATLIDHVAVHTHEITFAAGEQLITAGAAAECCWAIQSGRIAVGIYVPQTGLHTLETLHSGDLLGWSWLFQAHRWTFDAAGVKPGRALLIAAAPMRALLKEDPAAGLPLVLALAAVMDERLQSARARLTNFYGDGNDD